MTEEGKNNKYIRCSTCRSKYVNDEEHINNHLDIQMRYKTCARCRAINKINCKTYSEKHPEKTKEYYEAHKEEAK